MPAMAWYEFKVTGLLRGTTSDNAAEIQKFLDLFPQMRPEDPVFDPGKTWAENEPWPKGILLKNYKTAIWYCGAEQMQTAFMGSIGGAPVVTQLTFHVQLIGMYSGSIYSNKEAMLPEVTWYYNYCGYKWLQDLKTSMKALNADLAKTNRVINAVDVRDWKWYCGDGSGD